MKIKLVLITGLFFIFHTLPGQIVNKKALSERITGYMMNVTLNSDKKTISGDMDAYWINNSSDTVPDLRLHMYMNAFRSNRTTVFKESGGSPGKTEMDLGWTEIYSFTDKEGNDLIPRMKYISPDDGNPEDKTVLRVLLPEPAMPGDTVNIKMNFETKLPSQIRRTGFSGDFYFVAQWFPKFGVYENAAMRNAERGAWNCHQFHSHSEFYSNHSVYEVNITLPSDHITGSGGMLISEKVDGDMKTVSYRAEDIVDFAWTAWPGYAVYRDKWNNVDITLLLPEERKTQAGRQLTSVKYALEYLSENVGPYPWPHLTFVDPPASGSGAGGMEYTTLFTSASSFFVPKFLHMPEMVTIHEFGHAYFMGMLASNEFEEPWLDEGVNSYWEQRMMDHYYGKKSGMIDNRLIRISDISTGRLSYVTSSARQVITNKEYSWNYPHGTYSMMSYQKAATLLHTLEGIIGTETMNNVFREYYRRWAFRHPSGKDFIAVVNDVVRREHGNKFGADMNWYFDQTLYGTGICDYKVFRIINRKYTRPEGKADSVDNSVISYGSTDSLYTTKAQLQRIGELMLPVEVLIHFSNGEEILEKWDGKSRYKDFEYTGNKEIEWVKIDPDHKIKMDVNYINNSMTMSPSQTLLHRISNRILSFTQFFLSFMLL